MNNLAVCYFINLLPTKNGRSCCFEDFKNLTICSMIMFPALRQVSVHFMYEFCLGFSWFSLNGGHNGNELHTNHGSEEKDTKM